MILDHHSYQDFKTNFYGKIKDTSVFEVNEINFIKVVMECLVVRYGLKGKIKQYILYPFPWAYLFVKKLYLLRNKNIKKEYKKFEAKYESKTFDIILIDNGRTLIDRDEQKISFYFHNIRTFLKSKGVNFLHYYENYNGFVYEDDYNDSVYKSYIKLKSVTEFDFLLIKELKVLYKNIQKENNFDFTELENIKSGLTVFYETAKLWDFYIKKFKPKKIFILGHYHREGIIYACRKNNVEVVELQHGLIAQEDVFYVLPEIFKSIKSKSLFSDKIFTYGEYWNVILKKGFEYNPSQIKTIGYYLYEDIYGSLHEENNLKYFTENHQIVLITTQPALHKDFCSYLQNWLTVLKENSNIKFIIKLHPADKTDWYTEFKNNPLILITRIRLEVLFKYSTIHVTSYSTTLFDALRYQVKNYSINFLSSSDYVKKIVEEGISELVETYEIPDVNNIVSSKVKLSSAYFFDNPNLELLLEK